MNARKTQWTVEDVRAFLEQRKGKEVTKAAAQSFLRRHGEVVDRKISDNGQFHFNVYDPKQIREAVKNLPGQGGPGKPRPSRAKSASPLASLT